MCASTSTGSSLPLRVRRRLGSVFYNNNMTHNKCACVGVRFEKYEEYILKETLKNCVPPFPLFILMLSQNWCDDME